METKASFANFQEFWPFYLKEHANPLNRKLHFIGTLLVHVVAIFAAVKGNPLFFIFVPIVGYTFAWIGHFIIEKNRPATFKHPLWSLRGDFKMFYQMCLGKLW